MNKKFILGIILTFLMFNSFSQEQPNFVIFSGQITNKNSDKLVISNDKGFKKIIKVQETGKFSDTLNILETGMYSFYDGAEISHFYLKKGYNINLTIDAKQFDETIKYTGIGSENNNFLAKKYLINEQELGDYSKTYSLNEQEFYKKQTDVKDKYFNLLNKLTDKDFVNEQKKLINYDYLISLSLFESYHQYFTKDTKFKVSKDFLKPLNNIDYTNEQDYKTNKKYKTLVNGHYLKNINDISKIDNTLISIKNIKNKTIKNGVIIQLMNSFFNINNENITALYNSIIKNCTDKAYIDKFTKQYNLLKKLLKGNESPKFSYKDINGKIINLNDFKGKIVYIDVWATWCSPCRREIPFLKKLEKNYHGKDIVFISISIDKAKDYDKWQKMVKEKELKGYQLFADNDWESDFIKAYQIRGIPTFILINKKGKIISASAKRPSNPELKTQLDSLLK